VVVIRLAIAGWILVTLARVARVAWRERVLCTAVWRAVRPRHVGGALGLLVVVGGCATVLLTHVPGMDLGLGRLVGLSTNAVFAPLEEGLSRAGPPPASGPDWTLLLGASAFLLPLLLLLPWLAFVEEEVFRAGLERAGAGRVALASLAFGLVHLVMLVPLAAALAVGVAGAFYARVYRRAHADGGAAPEAAQLLFRPTRRARRAAAAQRRWVGPDGTGDDEPERRQAAGVFAATVWHTTFNSLVVLVVWLSVLAGALTAAA
jgi:membrane protease YdiL (CAAX protease family)